jgi:hypothetical protein
MSDPVKFSQSCEAFNRRVGEAERTMSALENEREILLTTSRDSGVMVGHARRMLAKVSHNIEFPDGFDPGAAQQDKAAE